MNDGIRFNKAFFPDASTRRARTAYLRTNDDLRASFTTDPILFISHRTGDRHAEVLAEEITSNHKVTTYLVEWDDTVQGDSVELPNYIMNVISKCKGFLVCVQQDIGYSMWVGYEIGGAYAYNVSRAKVNFVYARNLPSVLEILESLTSQSQLDNWIRDNVT